MRESSDAIVGGTISRSRLCVKRERGAELSAVCERWPGWAVIESGGILTLRSELLESVPGVAHGWSLRSEPTTGPPGPFDLGPALPDDPRQFERRRLLLAAAGISARTAASLHQVHGARLLRVSRFPRSPAPPRADGVWESRSTADGDAAPAVRTADCVAVLLAESAGAAVAALHCGWRGVAARIAPAAVATLAREGFAAGSLRVALGPAAGPCCYAVGTEVEEALAASCAGDVGAVRSRTRAGEPSVDLHAALALQLVAAGVPRPSIARAPLCTVCRADLFFSFRREGAAAGRMMAVVGWREPRPNGGIA